MAEQTGEHQEQGRAQAGGDGGTRSAQEQMQQEMQTLREDLQRVQRDLQQMAESAVGYGRESYEQARRAASEQMETGIEQVEQYMQERPLTTVLIAFGIGLITGTLFRR